jgi:lipopolysaccharide assembly protein A
MRILTWLIRGLIFFTLFAFALNNQQDVVLHGFFGTEWRAPMVIVVLAAFAAGCALGVIAMVPGWWRRHRREAAPGRAVEGAGAGTTTASPTGTGGEWSVAHPPREGL